MEEKKLDPVQPDRLEKERAYEEFTAPRPDEINPNRLPPEEPGQPYRPEIEPVRREHEQQPLEPLQPHEPLQPDREAPNQPLTPEREPAHSLKG